VNQGIGEDIFTHSKGRLTAQNSFNFNWILTYFTFGMLIWKPGSTWIPAARMINMA
jgi:hypothetical protein